MPSRTRWTSLLVAPVLALLVLGCQTTSPTTVSTSPPKIRPATGTPRPATSEVIEQAYVDESKTDQQRRRAWADKTFEEFERSVYKEPFPGGKYIVNGDIAIADRKQLREFFETVIKQDPRESARGALIVARAGGQDAVWNSTATEQTTYCARTTSRSRGTAWAAATSTRPPSRARASRTTSGARSPRTIASRSCTPRNAMGAVTGPSP